MRSAIPLDQAVRDLERTRQRKGDPVRMREYTVAGVPSAATWIGCAIIVTDETGGRTIATSDGTDWRRVSDGAIIT